VISDSLSPTGIRLIKKGEMILCDILLDDEKENYLSAKIPIPKKYILSSAEISAIQNAIQSYNQCIRSIAAEKGLAFVDVNALLKMARKDRVYNSTTMHMRFKNLGVFSLDGLHPNYLGQTLLANEFIKAINLTYGSGIPLVEIKRLRAIKSR